MRNSRSRLFFLCAVCALTYLTINKDWANKNEVLMKNENQEDQEDQDDVLQAREELRQQELPTMKNANLDERAFDLSNEQRAKEEAENIVLVKAIPDPIVDTADSDGKIDWHDYAAMAADRLRTGPGEQGMAAHLLPEQSKGQQQQDIYRVNGFNGLNSDQISVNRSVKDIRHGQCKTKRYLEKLPTVTVVVPFYNEHWSTLIRTVWSVLNRSPPSLLEHVILADDKSTKPFLGKQLDDYIAETWPGKVTVLRSVQREGLIRARLMGAEKATSDVIIFLDSHSECNYNWLPPLLEPIALDHKTAVCPFVDVVDFESFDYRAQDEGARGAFDWELFYKRLPLTEEARQNPTEPFDNPVMAGGYFAIWREWFWELGGYDEGLDIWGGEQYELSFKIWQCGGRLVDTPCSRVGHIYRKFNPFPGAGKGNYLARNYKRVAEVWMDEYAKYIYERRPTYRNLETGDLTKQKALRERLQCKSFDWFMKNIAFDLMDKYPAVEPKPVHEGEIRNSATNKCVDTRFGRDNEHIQLAACLSDAPGLGGEQYMIFTTKGEVHPRKRLLCFDVPHSDSGAPVVMWSCHGMKGNQHWAYDETTQQLRHVTSQKCLNCDSERNDLFMSPCDTSATQKWTFVLPNKDGKRPR